MSVFVHTGCSHSPRVGHGWDMYTGSGCVGFGGLLDLPGQVLQGAGSSQVFQVKEHGCPTLSESR